VGEGTDFDVANRREPGRLNTGITVVGKRAVVPRGVRIGRNVLIGEGARAADFTSRVVRSGSTVERPREKPARATTRAHSGGPTDGREAPREIVDRIPIEPESGGRSSPLGRRVSGETSD
jgi:hypothetical protein